MAAVLPPVDRVWFKRGRRERHKKEAPEKCVVFQIEKLALA
jgi:hypothetical protein